MIAFPAILFLLLSIFSGIALASSLLRIRGTLLLFMGALVGIVLSAWSSYLGALGAASIGLTSPLTFGLFFSVAAMALISTHALLRHRSTLGKALGEIREN